MIDFDGYYRDNYSNKIGLIRKFFRVGTEEAHDIVQDAFVKALTYQKAYKPKLSNINTWFNSLLFNVARNNREKAVFEEFREESHEVEEVFDKAEIMRKVVIYTDNETHIRVIRLFYVFGYTSTEIAAIIDNMSVSNVTTVCSRFKEYLLFDNGEV